MSLKLSTEDTIFKSLFDTSTVHKITGLEEKDYESIDTVLDKKDPNLLMFYGASIIRATSDQTNIQSLYNTLLSRTHKDMENKDAN